MTDKQLTPMQELIEFMTNGVYYDVEDILCKAKQLLPKEKQVIENAYDDGFENYRDASIGSDNDIIESHEYYNNKFKNKNEKKII